MKATSSRNPPAHVARQLRAEAGFGCVVCGSPIIEYHHIIPWAEKKHFDPAHMVALCRNHHHELGKRNKKHAYFAKSNPINIRHKRFKGYLVTNRTNQALKLGGTRFINCRTALSYFGIPLLSHTIVEEEIRISCFMPDDEFFPEIEIINNDLTAMIDNFWDIEFKSNYIKFRKVKGETFLSLDFRTEDAQVNGIFKLGTENVVIEPTKMKIGTNTMIGSNTVISNAINGVYIGDQKTRLMRPNYAMMTPRPVIVRFPSKT